MSKITPKSKSLFPQLPISSKFSHFILRRLVIEFGRVGYLFQVFHNHTTTLKGIVISLTTFNSRS